MSETVERQAATVEVKRRGPLRRLGCGLALVCWFLLLLTPCALFYLAANGEIRLNQTDMPQPHSQPRLLISLINDVDNRGLQILRSTKTGEADDTSLCVETAVTYLFWVSNEGNQDVSYCDCYTRADAAAAWTFEETFLSPCP